MNAKELRSSPTPEGRCCDLFESKEIV